MTDIIHVRGHKLIRPTTAAEHEAMIWKSFRYFKEEPVDARLPIRQTICEQAEIARESILRRNRMMRIGIECVVDRHTGTRAQRLVTLHDRFATAICQNQIVKRYQTFE